VIGFWLVIGAVAVVAISLIYSIIFWRTYDETWAWIHQRHIATGAERHIQKVRGVPMVPPAPPEGYTPPPRPSR